jgi:outer membrane protein assembly factor BamB
MPSTTRRALLGSIAGGSVAALAGCSSSCPDSESPEPDAFVESGGTRPFDGPPTTDWPAPRFDAGNTGYAPDVTPPSAPLGSRWQTTVANAVAGRSEATVSPPVVVGDRVFVATADGVTALQFRDGAEAWQSNAVTPTVAAADHDTGEERIPPVVDGDTVYVGGSDALVALDAQDGTVRWRYEASSFGPPAVADGTVYALATDGLDDLDTGDGLVALDAADATERWVQGLDVGPGYPAVAGGTVVAAGNAFTWGIDAATGDVRWQRDRRTDFPPVVAADRVYLGNYDGLHALELSDGEERWTFERGSGRTITAPVVADETLYVVERPREAGDATFALNAGDGPPDPRWCSDVTEGAVTAATADRAMGVLSGGARPDDAGSPLRLVAFGERLGASEWALTGRERLLPPAVVDGAVVVVDRAGTVRALGAV